MANVQITDLGTYTDPASTDVLPIVDVGADVTKKVSIADLLKNASAGTAAAPGIAFDGDNTGIYSPGADQVAISTNGTGRLFIDGSGRLGLGTSSPNKLLSVVGSAPSEMTLERTGSTENISIEYKTTSGSVFAGQGSGNEFTIGSELNLTSASNKFASFSSGTIELLTSGTPRFFINSTGDVGIGITGPNHKLDVSGGFNVSGIGTSAFTVNASAPNNSLIIDSLGSCLVGTSSARTILGYKPNFQVVGESAFKSTIAVYRHHDSASNGNCPRLLLARSGADTLDNTIVAGGNLLGEIVFCGADGVDLNTPAASIRAEVDGTPGANDMPGMLMFSVTADGASSTTEAMRIKNTRVINFSNAPVYADNAAAKTGGLVDGDVYRTSTGDLKIVYT